MSFALLLDSKCTIKRENLGAIDPATGGYGIPTYDILYKNVPCRFETLTKKLEILAYDKQAVFPDYFVYMEYLSDIKEGDFLIMNSREFAIDLVENWSEQSKYLKLAVTEIKRNE